MRDKRFHLGRSISMLMMLLGLNQIMMDLSNFHIPLWQSIVSVLAIIAFLYVLSRWHAQVIIGIVAISVSVVVIHVGNGYYEILPEQYMIEHLLHQQLYIGVIVEFFEWLFSYTFTAVVSVKEQFLWAGMTVYLLIAATYLRIAMVGKWTRWMLFIPLLGFISTYFFYFDLPWSVYNFYIGGLFIYYINVGYLKNSEKIESKRVAYRTTRLNIYGVTLIVCLLVVSNFTAAILPLETMNRFLDPYIPDVFNLRSDYERPGSKLFSFSSTSFQRFNDRLGGPIYQFDSLDLLRVRNYTDERYLRGVVKNVYDGNRWYSADRGYFENSFTEVSDQDSVKTMTVKYLNMATGTLFAPLGPVSFNVDEEHVIYSSEGEVFFQSDTFTQRPSFYRITFTGEDTFYDESVDYLTVPDLIETGVYRLTESIVNGDMTDDEKMRAIISYLRSNYSYSLIPDLGSSQRDFVSQFLLEGESGYCTYFASSLAIMGRIAGVPTRYVEGFVIPTVADKDNYYYVKDENAHTWVEAYIDGKGWVQYEATPVYDEITTAESTSDVDLQAILEEEIEQAIEEGNDEKLAELEALKEADLQKIRDNSHMVENADNGINLSWMLWLLIVPLLLMVVYVFGKVRARTGDYRYQSIRAVYNIKDLCFEKNREKGETIRRRIARVYPSLYNSSISGLIEKVLYGNYVPSKEELRIILEYQKSVRKLAIRRLGLIRYYQICYLPRQRKG